MAKEQFTKLYRPRKFDDVVSQQETVQILRNSVANNNTLKFILLKGTRGSGKCFSENDFVLTDSGYVRARLLKPEDNPKGMVEHKVLLTNLDGHLEQTSHYYSNGIRDC